MSALESVQVSTGVTGLDTLLHGGLPANRLYLLEGDPGTGKTTIALQFLLEGVRCGERGVYVTLSETDPELRVVAASHGWNLDGVDICQLETSDAMEDQYTLYHPSEVELSELTKQVLSKIDAVRPARVAFDSLSELRLLARDPLRFRRQVLSLKQFFAGRACTVLVIDDLTSERDGQLQSLAHGVIRLEQQSVDYGIARRRLSILKMRGLPFVGGFHDLAIHTGGMVVYPRLYDTRAHGVGPTLASNLPELDGLLGGGLAYGTSTLFIGPAGAGKTTLASQYVAAALADGGRAAVYLFDERTDSFLTRGQALGMDFAKSLDRGTLTLEYVMPGSLSPGELADCITREVDRGANTILLDSLNGYLAAVPGLAHPLIRVHELLMHLSGRGVATLMGLAQQGILGASMPVPLEISYVADTVILLRFFEAMGSVRRALSVVKKRIGPHESTIRELRIGPDRLYVGEALTSFQGVLTGVPQYRGSTEPLLERDGQ
jgi:circadian clock protein KaiC